MEDRFTFRAWNIAQKRYMEDLRLIGFGELNTFREVEEAELDKYGQPQHYTVYEEDEVVLEQCTGLKDKNGKLIYEGDLIKSPNNSNLLEVIWEESSWHTKEYKPNWKNELILDSLVAFYGVEIVGNIHEKESK